MLIVLISNSTPSRRRIECGLLRAHILAHITHGANTFTHERMALFRIAIQSGRSASPYNPHVHPLNKLSCIPMVYGAQQPVKALVVNAYLLPIYTLIYLAWCIQQSNPNMLSLSDAFLFVAHIIDFACTYILLWRIVGTRA